MHRLLSFIAKNVLFDTLFMQIKEVFLITIL
nr:MAG TPA: hypothetical protein [Caudoviricetes sp.]DAX17326.1 MAG TPA: hypothetical protein [Caudoviricetes sp.]